MTKCDCEGEKKTQSFTSRVTSRIDMSVSRFTSSVERTEERTATLDQQPYCMNLSECEAGRRDALRKFDKMKNHIEMGNGVRNHDFVDEYERQVDELGRTINELEPDELVWAYKDVQNVQDAIEQRSEELKDQEPVPVRKFRQVPGIDDVPKEVQKLIQIEDLNERVGSRIRSQIREELTEQQLERLEEREEIDIDAEERESEQEEQTEEEEEAEEEEQNEREDEEIEETENEEEREVERERHERRERR